MKEILQFAAPAFGIPLAVVLLRATAKMYAADAGEEPKW